MQSTTEDVSLNSDFSQYKATQTLHELATHPFDLTVEGHLTAERLTHFCATSAGYKLLYGTERVDETTLQALQDLAVEAQAIQKMQRLQNGEVMNVIHGNASENRPALHTALRDFFEQPNQHEAAHAATALALQEIEKLKRFMAKIDCEQHFTDMVIVAIGGSDLGPRATYLALNDLLKPNRTVHFISNVDPDDAAQVLKGLNLVKTLVVVISKSGTTLETATNEALVKERFVKQGLKPEKHFISVTMPGTPMDDRTHYLESFHLWDWVGGRYSTTSMVGGLLLSFAYGFEVYWEFLRGANAMDKAALNADLHQNIPLTAALLGIWNRDFLDYPTLAVIPYSQLLSRYPAHFQQVDMESNGKRITQKGVPVDFETGPIIWGEAGTNAQHSFYQLIHQGTTVVPVEFIGYKECAYQEDTLYQNTTSQEKLLANLFAQALGLASGQQNANPNKVFPGNRPSHILLGKKLTPFALGALLAFYEHKVAFQGFIWGINSFDQEGVQLGKLLASQIIQRFAQARDPNLKNAPYALGDALIRHLDTLQ